MNGKFLVNQKSCESCVKVYPGKVMPLSSLLIFTRIVSASGALTFAGRSIAYWVNNSPYTFVTRKLSPFSSLRQTCPACTALTIS
jgi:hypothetical protein